MPRDPFMTTPDESFAFRTLDVLRRRKILAMFVSAAAFASAVSFALYLPDLYKASAVLLVERPVPEVSVRPAVSGELENRLHVIKQEILSRARLNDLIARFNLYPELRQRSAMDGVFDQMRHDIGVELTGPEQVSGRKNTVSFELSYTGAKGDTVAEVANELANFYVSQNEQIRSQEATRAAGFLKAQLDATKQELERHEGLMRAYTSSHPGELPQQVDVNLAALERLNTQLRMTGERQIKLIEDRERLSDGLVVTTDAVTGERVAVEEPSSPLNDLLERKKGELQILEGQFTSRHPDVVRLRTEVASLERERQDNLVKQRQAAAAKAQAVTPSGDVAAQAVTSAVMSTRRRTIESLDAEIEKLKRDEAVLRQSISTIETRLEAVPERQQDFGRLTRDYQASKDLYDSLLKRYDDAQFAESIETDRQGERFRILEAAVVPSGPVAPNRMRLIVMGFLFALFAGAGAAFVAEQFDPTFHSLDDLREFTKLPVLGTLSTVRRGTPQRALRFAMTTATAIAFIWIIVELSTYAARGNEQLVWMLARGA